MDRVTSPIGRVFIHLVLILFAIYSLVPFFWTTLQSFKNLKDANSRVPKFFFDVTWENYQELWLRVVPQNLALIMFFLLAAVVILICLLVFARYMPVRNWVVYLFVLGAFAVLVWSIPQIVETERFYNFFINTLIVTVGTVTVSITIGALAGYGLARYAGYVGVVILIAALGFRALPRLAFILP
ncbi:MAG: hypothetical protein GWP61_27785, partial [Chloroflexi bacterium]|nr:hypothetical protein [Chloroflexota bacterium]